MSKGKPKFKRITARIVPDGGANEKYQKILKLIGEVVAEWASLDHQLVELLGHMAKCDNRIATIIYHSLESFAPRLAILKALAQHALDLKDRATLLDVLARLNELHKTRNDLIHASYSVHHDFTKSPPRVALKKHITRSARKSFEREILAQTGEIETHLDLLYALSQFLHMFLPPGDREAARYWLAIFLNTDRATSA